MATYEELHDLATNSAFIDRLSVAIADNALDINSEPVNTENHANRLIWAKSAIRNPRNAAKEMIAGVLIANKNFTAAQILGASENALKSGAGSLIDMFADGS